MDPKIKLYHKCTKYLAIEIQDNLEEQIIRDGSGLWPGKGTFKRLAERVQTIHPKPNSSTVLHMHRHYKIQHLKVRLQIMYYTARNTSPRVSLPKFVELKRKNSTLKI